MDPIRLSSLQPRILHQIGIPNRNYRLGGAPIVSKIRKAFIGVSALEMRSVIMVIFLSTIRNPKLHGAGIGTINGRRRNAPNRQMYPIKRFRLSALNQLSEIASIFRPTH
jgi:hypothetical protein